MGPYSRVEFDRIRSAAKARARKDMLRLSSFSVTLGVAQLLFIRWADQHLERATAVPLEVTIFLLYMAVVSWLAWRLDRNKRHTAPRCGQCHNPITRLSERVAVATGRCDSCGSQVIV
jgi:hypothetical protein